MRFSTSPWASPIVIIIKKNRVDIRLGNSLTLLMVYPMPLINELLEDVDKMLWYCSLDMASGFWVVTMTDRARAISVFITPFGLFEWNSMPFGLKNAPHLTWLTRPKWVTFSSSQECTSDLPTSAR
ncbi:hypothetical protein PI125_g4076 [Phytophthora idaei]|nr:hypothetical protein PI125_g4076 [Phytophthora idaei]